MKHSQIPGDINLFVKFITGYGFVDFESPTVAQKAVTALKNKGIQAQMAKVHAIVPCLPVLFLCHILSNLSQ